MSKRKTQSVFDYKSRNSLQKSWASAADSNFSRAHTNELQSKSLSNFGDFSLKTSNMEASFRNRFRNVTAAAAVIEDKRSESAPAPSHITAWRTGSFHLKKVGVEKARIEKDEAEREGRIALAMWAASGSSN